MPHVSSNELKTHFSKFITRVTDNNERFIITHHNKPMAALISLDDISIIEQHEEHQGLASVAGAWPEFEELAEAIGDIAELRKKAPRHLNGLGM